MRRALRFSHRAGVCGLESQARRRKAEPCTSRKQKANSKNNNIKNKPNSLPFTLEQLAGSLRRLAFGSLQTWAEQPPEPVRWSRVLIYIPNC